MNHAAELPIWEDHEMFLFGIRTLGGARRALGGGFATAQMPDILEFAQVEFHSSAPPTLMANRTCL